MSKTFDVYNIIMVKVEEDDLMSFLLKNDIDDNAQPIYPLELLTEEIMSVIPEYAYADYEGNKIEQTKAYRKALKCFRARGGKRYAKRPTAKMRQRRCQQHRQELYHS